MRYSSWDRGLHFLIGGGMVFLLLIEFWMQRPEPDKTATTLQMVLFGIHEFVGLALLVIILLRLFDDWQKTKSWFPWLSAAGLAGLLAELKRDAPGWFSGRLPEAGDQDYLPRTVHGFGLLLGLGFGCTGMTLFLTMMEDGSLTATGQSALAIHDLLGKLFWLFLLGHVGMAIYHQLLGHRVLQTMLRLTNDD